MKKNDMPLIVAVFLVIGGFLSGISLLSSQTGIRETAAARRDTEFLIPTAQGAENAAALFSARILPQVTAVSNSNIPSLRAIVFVASGAIKDPGASDFVQVSPRKR